jgi:hypothetical protein
MMMMCVACCDDDAMMMRDVSSEESRHDLKLMMCVCVAMMMRDMWVCSPIRGPETGITTFENPR